MDALGALGFALLLAHCVAHVALAVALARANLPRSLSRGVIAFVLPPLGVVWGWKLGFKRTVLAYAATLCAFTLAVVVIDFVR
jgi:uncharacterized membrane protein YqaE (UPF0057 family)